jgi:hypothetical protein
MSTWEKLTSGILGLAIWLPTGGLMFVHFLYSFVFYDDFMLGIIGMFIPPVGLVNAVSWLASDLPITAYLW